MTILRFPPELIENVLAHVSHRNDLLSLATTCHQLNSLIMPRHLEYRKIQLDNEHYRPHVWKHLARRKALTRNIRVVEITDREQGSTERYPSTLTDGILDGPQEVRKWGIMSPEELKGLAHTMNEALSAMENITHFTFRPLWNDELVEQNLEWIFFQTVLLKPSLHSLIFNGEYNCRGVPKDMKWNLPSLCVLHTTRWHIDPLKDLIRKGISLSQRLRHLIVSDQFIDPRLCLPSLEHLELGSINSHTEITPSIINFLSLNPSIRILDWSAADGSAFIPHPFPLPFLPNLMDLNCRSNFFDALESTYRHARKYAATQPKPWKIERLEVSPFSYLTPNAIISFECMEGESLRETVLRTNPDIHTTLDDWLAVSRRFPNMEELYFYTASNRTSEPWTPPPLTLSLFLEFIPMFFNLRKCHFTDQLVAHLYTHSIVDPRARLDTTSYYSGISNSDLDVATSALLQLHIFFLHLGQNSSLETLDFPFTLRPHAAKIKLNRSENDGNDGTEISEGEGQQQDEGSELGEDEEEKFGIIDLIRQPVDFGEDLSLPPINTSIRGYVTTLERGGDTRVRIWWQMRDEFTNKILFSSLVCTSLV